MTRMWVRTGRYLKYLVLAPMLPVAVGGCQDVRNGVVAAIQSAVVVAASENTSAGAEGVLQRGVINTLADAVFGKLARPTAP